MNWIDYICDLTKSAETPKKFRVWACIAALSAIAKRKIWLPKGDGETILYNLYPNLSILIVAQSGDQRKSFGVSMCEKIVNFVPAILNISGHNTIQSIVKDIQDTRVDKDGLSVVKSDGSVFLSSDEWTNLIMEDPSAMTQLNSLLDSHYHDHWKERTKNSGKATIENPFCTMFGATTAEHLEDRITKKDLLGGFFARTLIVSSIDPINLNALNKTTGKHLPYEAMAQHLNKIADIKGQFEWSQAGSEVFETWYKGYMSRGREVLNKIDRTNMIYKAQDHVLRIAMCLALAEPEPKLILTQDNIEIAIDLVQACIEDARNTLFKVGLDASKDETAEASKEVFGYLIAEFKAGRKTIRRTSILQHFYGKYNAGFMDKIEYNMEAAELIDIDRQAKDRFYKIKEGKVKLYDEMEDRLSGRKRMN